MNLPGLHTIDLRVQFLFYRWVDKLLPVFGTKHDLEVVFLSVTDPCLLFPVRVISPLRGLVGYYVFAAMGYAHRLGITPPRGYRLFAKSTLFSNRYERTRQISFTIDECRCLILDVDSEYTECSGIGDR